MLVDLRCWECGIKGKREQRDVRDVRGYERWFRDYDVRSGCMLVDWRCWECGIGARTTLEIGMAEVIDWVRRAFEKRGIASRARGVRSCIEGPGLG